ncbi:MAG: hypothetical protein Q9196_004593 [Gyalolechia fulgens]
MLFRRTAIALSRHAAFTPATRRAFTVSRIQRDNTVPKPNPETDIKRDPEEKPKRRDIVEVPGQTEDMIPFEEVRSAKDLLPPGAAPGTIPSDIEQATGLERLEILGKMQGIDIFDMKPLDSSRLGTLDNPIMVKSFGDEQYCGCTGCPADSHDVIWNTKSVADILVTSEDDDHGYKEKKTFADYVRPEYRDGR